MNLSDVKTQSPPESGLPSAVRHGDHKSRSIYNRISYTYEHTRGVRNTNVKKLTDSWGKKKEGRKKNRETERRNTEEGGRRKKRRIARIEGNNLHEFRSTSAGSEGREKKTGEITWEKRKLQTRKLSSFYYLRRDHGPASRELSGIPRSLNTPPSAFYSLGRELFGEVEKGTAHSVRN